MVSKQIWLGAFKWATIHYHGSKDSKTMTCQSWKSKKNPGLDPRPHSNRPSGGIFFRLPTLTGHSFGALWAMMMNSSSFESPKSYLFGHYLKNSSLVLLRYVILSWKVPIYYINRALMILNCPPLLYVNLNCLKIDFWHLRFCKTKWCTFNLRRYRRKSEIM